jgi:hypothetical protein
VPKVRESVPTAPFYVASMVASTAVTSWRVLLHGPRERARQRAVRYYYYTKYDEIRRV